MRGSRAGAAGAAPGQQIQGERICGGDLKTAPVCGQGMRLEIKVGLEGAGVEGGQRRSNNAAQHRGVDQALISTNQNGGGYRGDGSLTGKNKPATF